MLSQTIARLNMQGWEDLYGLGVTDGVGWVLDAYITYRKEAKKSI